MTGTRLDLGDSHNFGRRVSRRGEHIVKPRSLAWEQLLLDSGSPLRRLLDAASSDELGPNAFGFLPDLKFASAASRDGGEVDRIGLEPLGVLAAGESVELSRIAGRSLALWSWLGVPDLHWENLALGRDGAGHIVFTPLDIESLFSDMSLPTETKLLPDADPEVAAICRHASGVRRLLPFLGKPIGVESLLTMASSYRTTLEFLDRHGREIAAVFTGLPHLGETPIRVLLRGTDSYVEARTGPVWPPLLAAEEEQLERGDIPYFFRFYGRPGIHYYGDESLATIRSLPTRGDVPGLDRLLQLSRGLRSPNRRSLREEGLFVLLAAFDHASFAGRHGGDEFEVKFRRRSLAVGLPSGEELECRRDLGDLVGSVYLPCSCGEVETVLVPDVTACDG